MVGHHTTGARRDTMFNFSRTLRLLRQIALVVLTVALPVRSWATTKGPDQGGYKGTDATAFSFIDIAGANGAPSVLGGEDDQMTPLKLPFTFQFYGHSYDYVCVSSNGALYFVAGVGDCNGFIDFQNIDLSGAAGPNDLPAVFPLWLDLTFDAPGAGAVYYQAIGQPGSRRYIVQWNNVYPQMPNSSPVTFQIILNEGQNTILVQYKSLGPQGNVTAAAVGIRNAGAPNNDQQIPWSYAADVLGDSTALMFADTRLPPTIIPTGGSFPFSGLPIAGSGSAYGAGGQSEPLSPLTLTYQGTGGTVYGPTTAAPTNAGAYNLTVAFGGNSNYLPGSASAALTITPAAQTITFTSNPPVPATVGGTYVPTATGGGSGNPVAFSASGACSFSAPTVSFIAVGLCQVAANQAGNANYADATPVTQSFNVTAAGGPAATGTTTTSNNNPSIPGQSVTFTATVRRTSDSTAVTSGTVTFKEGASTLAGPTAVNASGQASFSTSSLSLGSHTITAFYNGNGSFVASNGSVVQVVSKLSTETNVYSNNNPSQFSDTVTFTAWVHRGLFPVGTGTVTFKDGATTLAGNVAVNALGLAFFSTSSLAVGNHAITATFNGTATLNTSTNGLNQVVNKAATSTDLVSSKNPSNRGQSVTFTATVMHNGHAVTAGSVTFKDGATVLGTNSLNSSGKATFSTSSLSAGDHNITAVYNGTPNYQSSSDTEVQTVRR